MNARIRMLAIGLVVPLILAVAGTVIVALAAPTLPDPIATHWGPDGVDGFGPAWATAILPLVIVIGYSLLVGAVIRSASRRITVVQKLLVVTAPFLATMVSVVAAGSVLIQRGLDDAADASSVVPVVLVGLGFGAALAVISWFVLPRLSPLDPTDPESLPDLALAPTARATWVRHAEPNRALGVGVIVLLALAVVVGSVALWAAAPLPFLLAYVVFMVVLIVLVAGGLSWRVSVDQRGFRSVSLVGLRFVYPLSELTSATVVQVNPIGDFGGWGLRWAGRWGVILRAGEALQVTRTNGKSFVITVPDAQTGARLLNALVNRVE